MREIKFRGRDTENGGFVFSIDIGLAAFWYGVEDGQIVDPEQFTGLRDKNGRDIYEGDIVHVIDNPTNIYSGDYTVVYEGSSFILKESMGICLDFYRNQWIEVIGNIHENQELLK